MSKEIEGVQLFLSTCRKKQWHVERSNAVWTACGVFGRPVAGSACSIQCCAAWQLAVRLRFSFVAFELTTIVVLLWAPAQRKRTMFGPCQCFIYLFIYFLWPPYSPALVNGSSRKFYTWWTLSGIREVTTLIFSWSSWNYRVGQKVTKFRVFSDSTRKLSALTPERGRIL